MGALKLRTRQGRLEARIPFLNGQGSRLAKTIDGYRWNPEVKCWSYPLSWESAVGLRRVAKELGVELEMSAKVREWGVQERGRRKNAPAPEIPFVPSGDDLIDLPIIKKRFPAMWEAMSSRPFQTQGVKFMKTRQGSLLADDPGLGKTLQTLATVVEAEVKDPILIIANKSAAEITWPNEIEKWLPGDYVVKLGASVPKARRGQLIEDAFDIARNHNEAGRRVWVIMNPHWVRAKAEVDDYGKFVRTEQGQKIVSANVPELFGRRWGAIVADESHETLACATGNAKKWSQQRQGLGLLESSGPKISISGTPMRGKPENLFGQLQWLSPQEYKSYWNWAKKHFSVSADGYGGAMVVDTKGMDEKAFYEEASSVLIRRDKASVASDLPPKQYAGTPHPEGDVVGVWLPLQSDQKKLYDSFVANQSIDGEDGTLDAIGALAVYTRMKQLATTAGRVGLRKVPMPMIDEHGRSLRDGTGKKLYEKDEDGNPLMMDEQYLIPQFPSNKYDWLCEWLEERDLLGKNAKGKGKVIIASQFRQVIDLFREDLASKGVESFAITGSVSARERVRQQDEFQNNSDSPKIFFVQSKAGGTSLTLDQADDVILLDEMWDPDVQTQIEDRAHRLSNLNHHVTIWYLRSLGTVEEYIGTTVEERNRVCREVLDGSRGAETKKKLIGR